MPITVVGHPKVIKTPLGKAIQFNGIDDALFIPEHPLAGASAFTFEAIFRPESGGAPSSAGSIWPSKIPRPAKIPIPASCLKSA